MVGNKISIKDFKDYLQELGFKGCSDGGCKCKNNTGMVTNGGCKCLNKLTDLEVKKLYFAFESFLKKIEQPSDETKKET